MKKIFSVFFILISGIGYTQNLLPILERPITIAATHENIPSVLNRIGQAGGFSFSYNSAIINPEETITLNVINQPVRFVLNEIFGNTMTFKVKSNYLILTKAPPPPVKKNTVVIVINGYVQDAETQEKVAQVSIYDKNSLVSATTDEYGYFNLKLEKKVDSLSINVSKRNYQDTVFTITIAENQYLNISIRPERLDSAILLQPNQPTDSAVTLPKEEFVLPYESEPNIQNIRDTLYELVQVSFLPFLGTNGRLSGNVINDYSINLLGGYSLGTRQIELGFFFNIDRGDVQWLQIAGFGNLVGGKVYGVQASGFFNLNGGTTQAVQLTGFANTNLDDLKGVQVAGFANTNLGSVRGVQVAGFTNFTREESQGVQVAGFGNMQIGDYVGSQFAGLTNFTTETISGSQVSAIFNYGGHVRGTQIGLINYADSLGGVPIGLLSIVKSGYHKIELSADEVFYTNLAFRSGVRKFHTMLMAGFKPQQSLAPSDTSVWTFGYGLGTARKLTRWWYLDLDLSSQHINKGSFTDDLSLLNKFYVGFDFQVAPKFSIALGATLNGYLTRTTYNDYPELFTDYQPKIFVDENLNHDINLKMWLGGKLALRFL